MISYGQPQYAAPQAPAYAQPVQYESPVAQFAAQMGEAQRRFAKASYYQELLNGAFFSTSDEISGEVEGELKAFVENRLANLLGIDAGPAPGTAEPQFNETEVAVLKAIVSKMSGDAKLGPRVAAVAKPQAAPARPKLQPRPAPEAARPQPPVQRQAPPQPQPQPTRQPPPPQPRAPQPQPRQEAAPPGPKAGFPPDGSLVVEGGRKYKVAHRQMFESEMTPQLHAQLMRMPVGRFTVLSDGMAVMREGHDHFTKAHLTNITTQTRDPGSVGIPFPTDQSSMAAATMMQSGQAINNYSTKISTVAAHVINEG